MSSPFARNSRYLSKLDRCRTATALAKLATASAISLCMCAGCGRPSDHPAAPALRGSTERQHVPQAPAGAPPGGDAGRSPVAASVIPTLNHGFAPEKLSDPQTVDVLLRIPAPLLDPGQLDVASRSGLRSLQEIAGVEKVFSRATPGELRLVVRTNRSDPQVSAALVVDRWRSLAPADFGAPTAVAVARGARARAAWVVTAATSESPLAWTAQKALPQMTPALAGASRVHIAGAPTPNFALEVLPPTLADQGVALPAVLNSVRAALRLLEAGPPLEDNAAGVARIRDALDKTSVPRHAEGGGQPPDKVPVSRLVALRRGLSSAPREALVGRNAALVLFADAGYRSDAAEFARQTAAATGHPQWTNALGATAQLLPLSIDSAQRFVLQVRPGQKPEPAEELAKRLLAVRDIPKVAAVVAVHGWDGVPAELDGAVPQRLPWTVWVTATGASAGQNLSAVKEILNAGPWQAVAVAPQEDSALAWLTEQPAAAGVLLSAADPAAVGAAATALIKGLEQNLRLSSVFAGPAPQPARSPYGLIDAALARQYHLHPQDLADVLDLLTGELALPELRGARLSLALPRGDMVAEQGRLPLDFEPRSTHGARPIDLTLLQRLPSQEPLQDRLRVDGEPALYVLAQSASATAADPIAAVREALRNHSAVGAVHYHSWTLARDQADASSCVP